MTISVHGTRIDVIATAIAMLVAAGLYASGRELRRRQSSTAGRVATMAAPIAGLIVGNLLIATDLVPDDVAWGGVVAGLALAAAAAGSNRGRAIVPWLVLVSAIGVYLTTPDTERAVIFGAVAVAIVVVHLLARNPYAGLMAAPAIVCIGWIGATDGAPRTAAVIAAIGCVGALPFLRWSAARHEMIVVAHVVAVVFASRVASKQDAGVALVLVAAELAAMAYVVRAERLLR